MAGEARLQQRHERRVHEPVTIGYVEADHALAVQRGAEPLLDLAAVHFLHDHDDVGPHHEFRGQGRVSVVVRAGGCDLDVRSGRENLLRGWAAKAVLAAYEQDVFQWSRALAGGRCRGGGDAGSTGCRKRIDDIACQKWRNTIRTYRELTGLAA